MMLTVIKKKKRGRSGLNAKVHFFSLFAVGVSKMLRLIITAMQICIGGVSDSSLNDYYSTL